MFVNVQVTFRHSTFQNVALKSWRMYHRRGSKRAPCLRGAAMLKIAAVCSPRSEFKILRGKVTELMADCAEPRMKTQGSGVNRIEFLESIYTGEII